MRIGTLCCVFVCIYCYVCTFCLCYEYVMYVIMYSCDVGIRVSGIVCECMLVRVYVCYVILCYGCMPCNVYVCGRCAYVMLVCGLCRFCM